MTDPSNRFFLGNADAAVVATIGDACGSDRLVHSAELLRIVADAEAFYRRAVALADRGLTPYPLVAMNGNVGGADFGPADPQDTELGLTDTGWAAISPAGARVPVGLINGDPCDQLTPPLAAARVIEFVERLALGDRSVDPADTLGEPSYPTGCRVAVDLGALYAGQRVDLVLKPTVTALDGFVAIRITTIPPTMTTARIVDGVHRACQNVDLSTDTVDVQDASRSSLRVDRVVEVLGVPPAARQSLAQALEASIDLELSLPTQYELPIVDMVRSWLRATGERFDPHAARTLLGLR